MSSPVTLYKDWLWLDNRKTPFSNNRPVLVVWLGLAIWAGDVIYFFGLLATCFGCEICDPLVI